MHKREALSQLQQTMTRIAKRIDLAPTTEEDSWLASRYITDFGRCLAFGIETSAEYGCPAPNWAGRGVNHTIKTLPVLIDMLNEISFRHRSHQLCEVLDGRMRMWFVELAAQYSYDSWFDSMKRHNLILHFAVRDLTKAARELDQLLMERSSLFCSGCCFALLREYRQDIDPKLTKSLPWWLRGGLERQTTKIRW